MAAARPLQQLQNWPLETRTESHSRAKARSGGTRGDYVGRRRQQPVGLLKHRLGRAPHFTTTRPSRSSGFYTDLSDEDLSAAQIHGAELHPHPVQVVRQGRRMLSEYSDGHTLQAMRGPDRKTRIGSDAPRCVRT